MTDPHTEMETAVTMKVFAIVGIASVVAAVVYGLWRLGWKVLHGGD